MLPRRATTLLLTGISTCSLVAVGGCMLEDQSREHALGERGEKQRDCFVLDFDTDGTGAPIAAGAVVEDAYRARGITIDVFGKDCRSDGLGVAFDSAHPSGGDNDLGFEGLGNLLINQEHFDSNDETRGRVDEPDDNAGGAVFEFHFATPVCVKGLTMLDIDLGERPAEIRLYGAADELLDTTRVEPMGNNTREDVAIDRDSCDVQRMTIKISSSGAIDNVRICRPVEPEPEPEPEPGAVRWTYAPEEDTSEKANDVATDASGDIYVGGYVDLAGRDLGLLQKLGGRDGIPVWTQQIEVGPAGVVDNSVITAVEVAGDRVFVAGYSQRGSDVDSWYAAYTTATGASLWGPIVIDQSVNESLAAIAVNAAGELALVGSIVRGGQSDIYVRKASGTTGAALAQLVLNPSPSDSGFGVAFDPEGNIVVVGTIMRSTRDGYLKKLGPNLETDAFAAAVFDGGLDDFSTAVAVDASGDLVVVGFSETAARGFDALIRKLDGTTYDELWRRPPAANAVTGQDFATDVAIDGSGNVIVHGYAELSPGNTDFVTSKWTSAGANLWTRTADVSSGDTATGVAVDPAGNVAVAGYTSAATGSDLWVRSYTP